MDKSINGTQENNPTMTTKKPKTKKNVMGPEYWRPDVTHIWDQGGYCWIHVFIVKIDHTSKTWNANYRKKVLQETVTRDNKMGDSTRGQPRKWG